LSEVASEFVERAEILLPDRQSAEFGMTARRNNPAAITTIPLEFVDGTRAVSSAPRCRPNPGSRKRGRHSRLR